MGQDGQGREQSEPRQTRRSDDPLMSEGEWSEAEWEGTLATGLAQRVDPGLSDLTRFETATGRADLETAIYDLVEALGGDVEYTESTDSTSEAHLRIARVHLRLRTAAWKLVEQAAALIVALVVLNPGGVVHAVRLVETLIRSATILSPEERDAVALIMANQRRGVATPRDGVGRFGVDVDSLIVRGVLDEGEDGLSVNA